MVLDIKVVHIKFPLIRPTVPNDRKQQIHVISTIFIRRDYSSFVNNFLNYFDLFRLPFDFKFFLSYFQLTIFLHSVTRISLQQRYTSVLCHYSNWKESRFAVRVCFYCISLIFLTFLDWQLLNLFIY